MENETMAFTAKELRQLIGNSITKNKNSQVITKDQQILTYQCEN
jgi:hypothetical protein